MDCLEKWRIGGRRVRHGRVLDINIDVEARQDVLQFFLDEAVILTRQRAHVTHYRCAIGNAVRLHPGLQHRRCHGHPRGCFQQRTQRSVLETVGNAVDVLRGGRLLDSNR